MAAVTRDFTVATFVVYGDAVLLLLHRKLAMWLPPGGHIEPNELPDEAAVREVWEETGVCVRLLPEPTRQVDGPLQLARPEGLQLERIGAAHEHVDLIYFAVPLEGTAIAAAEEGEQVGWYLLADLAGLGVTAEVRCWARQAVVAVRRRLAAELGGKPATQPPSS